MKRRITVACVLTICVFASNLCAQRADGGADGPPRRSVTTTGEAVIFVVPDEVIVNFGVETFDGALHGAKTQNDAASKKLLEAMRNLGIEAKHIQTSDLEVDIDYTDDNRATKRIEYYVARRMYSVTLKDTSKFEAAVDAALNSGANRLMGFEYRTTQLRKHRDEARRMAIRAAREKADALARELECQIGKPLTIGEGYNGSVGTWGSRWGGNVNRYQFAQNVAQSDGGANDEDGQTLPLGQVGVRAQITVTFELSG